MTEENQIGLTDEERARYEPGGDLSSWNQDNILRLDSQIQELRAELNDNHKEMSMLIEGAFNTDAKLTKALELLRRVQWGQAGFCPDCERCGPDSACRDCQGRHAEDCELARLIGGG